MTHRSKTVIVEIGVIHALNDARNDLKKVSPQQHAAIDQVISAVTGLLTEEDKKIMLPAAVKDKIKKLIGLTIEEPEPKSWIARTFHKKMTITEYRYRLALLSTCLVTFIHSYK